MLGSDNLLSRPSKEKKNWGPLIKKKKTQNFQHLSISIRFKAPNYTTELTHD